MQLGLTVIVTILLMILFMRMFNVFLMTGFGMLVTFIISFALAWGIASFLISTFGFVLIVVVVIIAIVLIAGLIKGE